MSRVIRCLFFLLCILGPWRPAVRGEATKSLKEILDTAPLPSDDPSSYMSQMRSKAIFWSSSTTTAPKTAPVAASTTKKIVGFYSSYSAYNDYAIDDIPVDQLTHIKYAFFDIDPSGKLLVGDEWMDITAPYQAYKIGEDGEYGQGRCECCAKGTLNRLWEFRRRHPHIKTLLSVGGWSSSTYFSDVVATVDIRRRFAISIIEYMIDYGFDGVDIDWEYPISGGAEGIHNSIYDTQNMLEFLRDLRYLMSLIPFSPPAAESWLLTFDSACPPSRHIFTGKMLRDIAETLDWFNVMCYEFSLSASKHTQHNANLYGNDADPAQWVENIDKGINWFLTRGVDRGKLVLGVPLYGRASYDVEPGPSGSGLFQPYTDRKGEYIPYHPDILTGLANRTYHRSWDPLAMAATMYDAYSRTFISFDDLETVERKVEYINENELGGFMVWDLSSDAPPTSDQSIVAYASAALTNLEAGSTHPVRYLEGSRFCNVNGTITLRALKYAYGGGEGTDMILHYTSSALPMPPFSLYLYGALTFCIIMYLL